MQNKITNNAMENLSICWEPTTTCNYACWYCDPALHDGKYKWPDLDAALDFFSDISKEYKQVYLDMVGGEPTLWPHLTKFITNKPDNMNVNISSNGSRTINWWQKNWPFIKGTCLTFHPDSADPDHFFNVVGTICSFNYSDRYIQVSILTYDEKLDVCLKLFERLEKANLPIDCRIKLVDSRYVPSDIITRSKNNNSIVDAIKNKQFYKSNNVGILGKPTEVYYNDKLVSYSDIFLWKFNNFSNFKGWRCSAGKNRLYIEANGDIFRCSFKNDGKIGNIYIDTNIKLTHTICKQDLCGCADELIIEKQSIV